MIKSTLNYKLINTLLIIFMIYLVYQTRNFWLGFLDISFNIISPFLIAFSISYALSPILTYLMKKGLSKWLSVFIILFIILGIIFCVGIFTIPTIFLQAGDIFGDIIGFLKRVSLDYNISFDNLEENINKIFNNYLEKITNGAFDMISISLGFITKAFIVFISAIYFLLDMDKIRESIKNCLKRKKIKLYKYVVILDIEMTKYLGGFLKIMVISFFEYFLIYIIIGHPNYFLLGSLASICNLVPYFGGIFTNIIAAITALAVSDKLFIKTCIVFIIFSMIDGYVINPLIFGKSNKLHPLAVIISVFAGGVLFGITGIIISLPFTIILISTYKYFKKDISIISKKTLKK